METSALSTVNSKVQPIRTLDFKYTHESEHTKNLAQKILIEFLNFRRVSNPKDSCKDLNCLSCLSMHLPKVISSVLSNEPVPFVLPAFPGKSPNTEKVLGPLPDLAEELSLRFLNDLTQKVKVYYPPGLKIILCSDGRVFSDIIGIQEENITSYQNEINQMIQELDLTNLVTFNLDDYYGKIHFSKMRDELMKSYGHPLDFLKNKVRNGKEISSTADEQESHRMYCGMTRFLFEDSNYHGQTKSRTQLQKESRSKAYEVIQRSNAWSDLIAEKFPEAVRLSIHPQACGGKKMGIRLIGNENWMTPWHGVAVETNKGYILLKRKEAEALGAKLIYSSKGRPSHYRLDSDCSVITEMEL